MKSNLITLLTTVIFSVITLNTFSQTLSTPIPEGVYGGQILDIESWEFDTDSIYVVVSTESPNSIFIAKALRASTKNNLKFNILESAGSDDGYGSNVENIEVHQRSNTIFFLSNGSVYKTGVNSTSASLISNMVKTFIIQRDTMCLIKNNILAGGNDTLEFGPIDASGNFASTNGFSLLKKFTDPPQLLISPVDNRLNLFDRGASAQRQIVDSSFNAMTNSSSLSSAASAAPIISNIEWKTTGIANDGTIYVAGQPPLGSPTIKDRRIAWTNDNGLNWKDTVMNGPGPKGGVVGSNIIIDDLASSRHLFCGNLFLTDTSSMNNWFNPGKVFISNLNRANDGKTLTDPIDKDIKYHTTNIGFGYSTSSGDNIYGWNEGLEAVQVNDIDMNPDFSIGWVASKSGIRKVEYYNTPSEVWHPTYFPNLDGSPYLCVAVDTFDHNTVFVGNQRVYRTTNGGTASSLHDGWDEVFTPEIGPYNFNRINTKCNVIAISKYDRNIILAGFSQDYGNKGGAFFSLDGGNTWSQLLLKATSFGQDLDVIDIEIVEESGNIVAYIGIESDPMTSGAYGVYRAELSSGIWTISQAPVFGATDNIIDLEMNIARDTLIVLYRDPAMLPVNNVIFKDINTGTWSANNFGPSSNNGNASAITIGDNFIFMAIDENIYTTPISSSLSWTLAYSYPVGIDINVLYYDELLVGTSTGLYAQDLEAETVSTNQQLKAKIEDLVYSTEKGAIKISMNSKIINLSVFDIGGKLIFEANPNQNTFEFTHKFNSGVYIINITNEAGEIHSDKIAITSIK